MDEEQEMDRAFEEWRDASRIGRADAASRRRSTAARAPAGEAPGQGRAAHAKSRSRGRGPRQRRRRSSARLSGDRVKVATASGLTDASSSDRARAERAADHPRRRRREQIGRRLQDKALQHSPTAA